MQRSVQPPKAAHAALDSFLYHLYIIHERKLFKKGQSLMCWYGAINCKRQSYPFFFNNLFLCTCSPHVVQYIKHSHSLCAMSLFWSWLPPYNYHRFLNLSEGGTESETAARRCENDTERLSERDRDRDPTQIAFTDLPHWIFPPLWWWVASN